MPPADVPAPLQLDVLEAAAASKNKKLVAKVDTYRAAKPKGDALAAAIEEASAVAAGA